LSRLGGKLDTELPMPLGHLAKSHAVYRIVAATPIGVRRAVYPPALRPRHLVNFAGRSFGANL